MQASFATRGSWGVLLTLRYHSMYFTGAQGVPDRVGEGEGWKGWGTWAPGWGWPVGFHACRVAMSFMCLLALSHCDVCSALSARSVRSGSTRRSCETPVTGSCCCGSRVWMAPSRTRSTRFSLQTFQVGWPARIILPPLHTRLRTRSHNDLRTQTTHMYRHPQTRLRTELLFLVVSPPPPHPLPPTPYPPPPNPLLPNLFSSSHQLPSCSYARMGAWKAPPRASRQAPAR